VGLEEIRQAMAQRNYRLSLHARRQMGQRRITSRELEEAVAGGEVIEDYPEDKYRHSCLILGMTSAGRPLHLQCSEPMPEVIVVTCYDPDPGEWVDYRRRRGSR
jgi:hypothetical protein